MVSLLRTTGERAQTHRCRIDWTILSRSGTITTTPISVTRGASSRLATRCCGAAPHTRDLREYFPESRGPTHMPHGGRHINPVGHRLRSNESRRVGWYRGSHSVEGCDAANCHDRWCTCNGSERGNQSRQRWPVPDSDSASSASADGRSRSPGIRRWLTIARGCADFCSRAIDHHGPEHRIS